MDLHILICSCCVDIIGPRQRREEIQAMTYKLNDEATKSENSDSLEELDIHPEGA